MNRKIMSSVYFLLMTQILHMTLVRLSQSFPQLGLDEDTLRDEFLEHQLENDAEMLKHLQVDKF